jgi:hypothetical protein
MCLRRAQHTPHPSTRLSHIPCMISSVFGGKYRPLELHTYMNRSVVCASEVFAAYSLPFLALDDLPKAPLSCISCGRSGESPPSVRNIWSTALLRPQMISKSSPAWSGTISMQLMRIYSAAVEWLGRILHCFRLFLEAEMSTVPLSCMSIVASIRLTWRT